MYSSKSKQFDTVSKPPLRVHDAGSYIIARRPPDSIFNNRNCEIADLLGHEGLFFGKDQRTLLQTDSTVFLQANS
jgi:hypothetical protein